MPNKDYIGNKIFNCIDVIDENCGVIGRINSKINNIISVSGIGYVFSNSFDVGGTKHDGTFYYPTKDSNQLGDTYTLGNFEKGKFIKHIYTGTLSNNVKNIIVEYDIYMEESHTFNIDVCEVIHGVYSGNETTDLPSKGSQTLSLSAGNHKGNFSFPINISSNLTFTVRISFTGNGSHGNDPVTMACTLYGTA